MALTRYPAVLEESDGAWGAWFPDFPGCVGAGETMHAAVTSAGEALTFHIQGMMEDGEPFPAPSSMTELSGVATDGSHVLFAVDADVPETAEITYTRLNITMPDTIVNAIDRVAANRSAWLAEAAREKLHRDPLAQKIAAAAYKR
jgi:predicted RNase H-like HicB family nuclease